jgi:hypothetical protein
VWSRVPRAVARSSAALVVVALPALGLATADPARAGWTRPVALGPAPPADDESVAVQPVVVRDGRAVVAWRSGVDEATPDRLFEVPAAGGPSAAPRPSPLRDEDGTVALAGTDVVAAIGDDRIVALADDPRSPTTRLRFGVTDASLRPAALRTVRLHGEPRRAVVRARGGRIAIAALVAPAGGDSADERLVVATGPADGPLRLRALSKPGAIEEYDVAIGSAGDVAAVWTVEHVEADGRSRSVLGRTLSADGRRGPLRALGPRSRTVELGSVDVDHRGRSAATWVADRTPVTSIGVDVALRPWVARAARAGAFVPVRYGEGGRPLSADRAFPSADAVAATFGDTGGLVLAVSGGGRVAAGPLARSGRLRRLNPRGHAAVLLSAAGAGGRAAVAWAPVPGVDAPDPFALQPAFVAVREPGGHFGGSHRLGAAVTDGPALAFSPDGSRLVAAWLRGDRSAPRYAELLP